MGENALLFCFFPEVSKPKLIRVWGFEHVYVCVYVYVCVFFVCFFFVNISGVLFWFEGDTAGVPLFDVFGISLSGGL